jgi:hypothetical protein
VSFMYRAAPPNKALQPTSHASLRSACAAAERRR